ncbi:hypothetical protein [Telluribacter sp.]|jgi:hypothetical protein|uniref:hypothetical protein n=1 Tax=Telluribacter sp. TaxID=1978767 RepID=UPI002E123C2C|nr:hypothetical protein [Telluribacter sp.]
MKRFIPILIVIVAFGATHNEVIAQNEEYYKIDSTRNERPRRPTDTSTPVPPVVEEQPQQDGVPPLSERIRLGGSFGLGFGTVTNINLSPMAGLQLTDKLVGGVGVTYMWLYSRRLGVNNNYYGGRTFLMYSILPMITLQAEYEGMNVQYYNPTERRNQRMWIGSPLVGGAYTQPLGGRYTRAVHMTLLYNLNHQNQLNPFTGRNISPYISPFVFRITFL